MRARHSRLALEAHTFASESSSLQRLCLRASTRRGWGSESSLKRKRQAHTHSWRLRTSRLGRVLAEWRVSPSCEEGGTHDLDAFLLVRVLAVSESRSLENLSRSEAA
jgi:hypothetical protein